MTSPSIEKAIKHSLIYSITLSQPLLLYPTSAHAEANNTTLLNEHTAAKGYEPLKEQLLSTKEITLVGTEEEKKMQSLIMKEKEEKFNHMAEIITNLHYGEKSKQVKIVQQLLTFYGYYEGEVDGIYGPLTDRAINIIKEEGLIEKETSVTKVEIIPPKEIPQEDKGEKVKVETVHHDEMIATAKEFIGVPYTWGGTSPSGFDCSGYIQYVYRQHDQLIPRTTREIWNFSLPVEKPMIGDVLFFETYQAGPSHLGIYLGNGDFIHAGSSTGVTISNYQSDSYWKTRYIGVKRIPYH